MRVDLRIYLPASLRRTATLFKSDCITPRPESTAWGEEIADSMESASEMIAGLAASFSIPQDRITLEIRMDDVAQSTRH